ncbi:SNF1-related protein kinase [Musa troglodytarum]|uniref:SNF1-related protein kinase n=1 Tax=Musa troglodytarum TaxID=320322 RepID=A0A9E7I2U8_9LILI|nr:SNF1-related protein kinase [Musa troglodytarum]
MTSPRKRSIGFSFCCPIYRGHPNGHRSLVPGHHHRYIRHQESHPFCRPNAWKHRWMKAKGPVSGSPPLSLPTRSGQSPSFRRQIPNPISNTSPSPLLFGARGFASTGLWGNCRGFDGLREAFDADFIFTCFTVKMEGSSKGGGSADVVLQNYKLGKTLGIGSFGKVKIAEHLLTGHKVAIKILNRRKIKNMEMEEKVLLSEKPSHAFLIKQTNQTDYFFFPLMFDKISMLSSKQIISGVEYCHRNMVAHRDLKPENLLLDSKCNVKIADFGLSNVMRDGHFLKTSCGSPNYAAPEVISGKLYAGPEVDVWSCGVILYALLCGTLPFDDENIPNLFKKIKARNLSGIYTLPSHLSALARDLIPRMLVVDPMKRITIREIREHPWFQVRLPRYLAVPPPDTMQQARKAIAAMKKPNICLLIRQFLQIDDDILQEVIKMGFDKNQLVESLHNRISNEATVSYYLLLDNRFRAMSGYLGGDFQETMDYGVPLMSSSENSAFAHHLPGYMDPQGIGLRSQLPVERKWALGLQSRAHPREIMTEVLKALQELNVRWKRIGHYNMKCCYIPGFSDHAESMLNNSPHANHSFSDESAIVESDNIVKFEIQVPLFSYSSSIE